MKKNKDKAFTLIEVIAIMVVLTVISAITIPAVSKTINNSYAKSYEISLASMKDAAKGYLLKKNVEIQAGIQTRIELSDMVQASMIDEIINTKSKETCDGYVAVTLANEEYSFQPYLNCGADYKSEDYDKTDYVLPTISLLGNNPMTINVGETYIEPGFVASDDVDGDVTDKVLTTGSINPNSPASYEITYSVTDSANNLFEIKRTVTVVDAVAPIVTYEPNGNGTYAKSGSTIVRVRDNAILNASSLKYHWVNSTAIPTESCFITTFTNNSSINTPSSATGQYYLWILAKDSVGNTSIIKSNIFYLDNTKPVIALNGSASITVNKGSTYTDAGATASDNIDGDITSNITSTSNININVAGSYTVTYNVADKLGNQAASVIRTVNVVIPTYANAPALTSGMTPIKWNGSAWVDTTESDTSWYNYDTTNKQWANARTSDGSMWVWIPRYIYKISSGWHTATSGTIGVQFTKGTNDNWNSSVIGNINTDTTANASNGTWTNHPAFTFGSTELTGIWVAKFEASSSNPAATNGGGNVTTLKAKSLPNVVSWRGITVGNIFTVTRSMETDNTYGWGTTGTGIDTHLIKNVEWGAVAYLAQSAYGKNGQVAANSSSNYYTGGGISNAYVTNIVQSTTGNIYGIYDMSGGTFEFTAAFLDDEFASDYGASIASAADKYYDAYSGISDDPASLNYNHALYKKGDAIYETSASVDYYGAWYGEIAGMPYYYYPWFVRSSVFGFAEAEGWEAYNFGFRPVLLVNTGL